MSSKESEVALQEMLDLICIVSNRVAAEGQYIGHIYREKPDFEEDTGWRILAGAESQKYLDKEENLEIWTIAELLGTHQAMRGHLHLPIGSELLFDEAGMVMGEEDSE